MLRNVLDEYLAGIRRERDFDSPFLALLGAMGYEDVHLTHGSQEKGKDFIAKRDGSQWVFQSKKGDLATAEIRELLPQLLEAATMGLSHPSFDASLPRRIVLVTTGLVNQEGNDRIAALSADRLRLMRIDPIDVWSRPKLVDLLLRHGVEGFRGTRLRDIEAHGRFFALYGSAVRGNIAIRDVEEHSVGWLDEGHDERELTLLGSTEAAILSRRCAEGGLLYEAWQCELSALRMAMFQTFKAEGARRAQLADLCRHQLEVCAATAAEFAEAVLDLWRSHDRRLDRAIGSPSVFITYPVIAMRTAEALAFLCLHGGDRSAQAADNLVEFILAEPGACRPISDRYSVSAVAICLALWRCGRGDLAVAAVRDCATWLLDRFEFGNGLAHVDASVQEEVDYVLGPSFSTLKRGPRLPSLLASALIDLAAFLDSRELYADLVNDLQAVGIHAEYFQAVDTEGQFLIEHETVVHYTAISFREQLPRDGTPHSDYGAFEPSTYALAAELPAVTYLALSLFLRDRYFPLLWGSWVCSP